uniref:Uncharacterized protein n=1 Tax=Anguilla anguilla TaxID=7936 RepID=A0A0E9QUG6_ANGAN
MSPTVFSKLFSQAIPVTYFVSTEPCLLFYSYKHCSRPICIPLSVNNLLLRQYRTTNIIHIT